MQFDDATSSLKSTISSSKKALLSLPSGNQSVESPEVRPKKSDQLELDDIAIEEDPSQDQASRKFPPLTMENLAKADEHNEKIIELQKQLQQYLSEIEGQKVDITTKDALINNLQGKVEILKQTETEQ